ncbi:piezo-type mechanosensitive ion channel homolog isoform X1 [Tanacetum coccineum]
MRVLVGGFLLSLILFTAALLNCSLISLGNFVASLLILFVHLERASFESMLLEYEDFTLRGERYFGLLLVFQLLLYYYKRLLFSHGPFGAEDALQKNLFGQTPTVIYVLILQSLAAFIAFTELQEIKVGFFTWASSFLGRLAEAFDRIGRFTCEGCFFLAVACHSVGCGYQLHVLGFFTVFHFQLCGSCGLVINEQLSWPLQLPTRLPKFFSAIGDFIGIYRISSASDWAQICSGLSLIIFFFGLSFVKLDLEEMNFIMSIRDSSLNEQLLPSTNSFFIRESRSGERDTNLLLRGPVFRTFSINFFTYGAPVHILTTHTHCPCMLRKVTPD